jgi:hypothetical protein
MVTEEEYRALWKELHEIVSEYGGTSPGPVPKTRPGTYRFEWIDGWGCRRVRELRVVAVPVKENGEECR